MVRDALLHAAGGPDCRYRLSLVALGGPVAPALFEKTEEFAVMNLRNWLESKIVGCDHLAKFDRFQTFEDIFRTHRAFKWWHQLAAVEFGFGIA